jgi:RNA polymerase sigma factor (sigma-70 family)
MESGKQEADAAEEAFRGMVHAHRSSLIRYGMRRLEDHEAVDELVGDTFLTAWRRWADKPGDEEELFWLYSIAHKGCLNLLRGQHRRQRLYRRLAQERRDEDATWDPTEGAIDELIVRIEELPSEHREALQLAYWEGLSHREIGLVLDCSENAVGLRLSRARQKLREQLDVSSVADGS